jgi:16S rRNA C967 or C1407 C5-methylase (RsmB/RsmF family)
LSLHLNDVGEDLSFVVLQLGDVVLESDGFSFKITQLLLELEKEMQDALDPTIGQTEIVAMKKEIHRMELRYDQLRKKQEEMIKDMERSVFKRETIQLKYLPKVEKTNAADKSSQGKLSR